MDTVIVNISRKTENTKKKLKSARNSQHRVGGSSCHGVCASRQGGRCGLLGVESLYPGLSSVRFSLDIIPADVLSSL